MAGDADPQTGYQILVDGQQQVVGGTSAVAPLWAALVARLAQAAGQPFGLIQPALYTGTDPGIDAAGFTDITRGTTEATRPDRDGMPAPVSARPTAPRCLTGLPAERLVYPGHAVPDSARRHRGPGACGRLPAW